MRVEIIILVLTSCAIDNTCGASLNDFLRKLPEKIADAFRSSWRVIAQGSSDSKYSYPKDRQLDVTEAPLWIKIPKRQIPIEPKVLAVEEPRTVKPKYSTIKSNLDKKNLIDADYVTKDLQKLYQYRETMPNKYDFIHKQEPRSLFMPNEPRSKKSKTRIKIPFFKPPQSKFKYLMRTAVIWRKNDIHEPANTIKVRPTISDYYLNILTSMNHTGK